MKVFNVAMGMMWLGLAATGLASAAEADFGLISLSGIETARLSAYCDGTDPCEVTLQFHHISGRTLKESSMTVQPGTIGFLDFNLPVLTAGGPIQIDPCWKILRGQGFASLEVFDNFTQRTRLLSTWGGRSQRLSDDIDFGVAGITALDTMRLGAYCEGDGSVEPTPCAVTLEFHDGNGRTIKQSTLILQPETGGIVDLKYSETGGTTRRVQIDPCVKVLRGTIVPSMTLVDTLTGLTLSQGQAATLVTQ